MQQIFVISSDIIGRDRWTDLPIDILILVLNLVSFQDLVRLTALCKTWQPPALDSLRRRPRNLPWLISFNQGKFKKLDLIDPWLNKSFSLVQHIRRDGVRKLLVDSNVHASKHGWLLMSKNKPGSGIISFLFYNPFRNKIIKSLPPLDLHIGEHESRAMFSIGPPLDLQTGEHESRAMFSTAPTSPDCVIFVLSRVGIGNRFSTYKDKKWNTISFSYEGWRGKWIPDVTYSDGKFYCLFDDRENCSYRVKLGIYDVALEEWNTTHFFWPEGDDCEHKSLIEFDGEVLMVVFNRRGINIWQFDGLEKAWIRSNKSLGDRVLFVNRESCSSSSMEAVGEAKELANKIVRVDLLDRKVETYTGKDDQRGWRIQECCSFCLHESTFWIDVPDFSNGNI